MNDLAVKFLEILRDPINKELEREYKRIKGFLKTEEGFCAGGILCDLISKKYPEWKWISDGDEPFKLVKYVHGVRWPRVVEYDDPIPDCILSEIGLPPGSDNRIFLSDRAINYIENHGMLFEGQESKIFSIAMLNDSGVPWEVIADIFEDAIRENEGIEKNEKIGC